VLHTKFEPPLAVNPLPNISAGNDASICNGGTATLTASGGTNYLWSTTETTSSIDVSPVSTTTYYVTATDANGCTNTDDVPSLDFHPEITSGCQPLLVNFNNLYYDENFNYTWNFGDNEQESLSFEINPSHVYEEPGIYDVSLSVVTNDGCESSTEFTELIHVYEKPEAKFEADPKLVSVVSPRVLFSNLSTHLDTCIWGC